MGLICWKSFKASTVQLTLDYSDSTGTFESRKIGRENFYPLGLSKICLWLKNHQTGDRNKMGWSQSRRIETKTEASDEGRKCRRNIVEMTTTEEGEQGGN